LVSVENACEPDEPIKTDVRGRLHRTTEQRDKILDEYERSGLSGPKFAALCGVPYQTFATWVQRRKRQRKADLPKRRPARKLQWLEAQVRPVRQPSEDRGLMMHFPGGVRAEITGPEHVSLAAALVRAWEKPC
jgi:hypothetical protein